MELIFCGCFKVIKYMKNPCYETGVLYNVVGCYSTLGLRAL